MKVDCDGDQGITWRERSVWGVDGAGRRANEPSLKEMLDDYSLCVIVTAENLRPGTLQVLKN